MDSIELSQAHFALNLLRGCGDGSESALLSPFSIASVLTMAYAGMRGKTEIELGSVLGPPPQDMTHKKAIDADLVSYVGRSFTEVVDASKYGRSVAFDYRCGSKMLFGRDVMIHVDFLNTISSQYECRLKPVDFAQPETIANEINEWVDTLTESKVKDVISTSDVDNHPLLVLINASFFKASWCSAFNEFETSKMRFHEAPHKHRTEDMMEKYAPFLYLGNENMQVLGLGYVPSTYVMFVFLPTARYGLKDLEESLSGEKMLKAMNACSAQSVAVKFPKFKLEQKFELTEALKRMGIREAFSSDANMSGMSTSRISVSKVIQKTFIEVNEKGTLAESTEMREMGGGGRQDEYTRFVADHPFMFVIAKQNTILFIGRVR